MEDKQKKWDILLIAYVMFVLAYFLIMAIISLNT